MITDTWIKRVIDNPAKEIIQEDGRIRRWGQIKEMDGKYLRVILLEDGETVQVICPADYLKKSGMDCAMYSR